MYGTRITRRQCLQQLSAAAALIAAPQIASSKPRPNVIMIITDDQGYGDLACQGNPILNTPHLDALYKESVRFTQFHVSPTCAPTRAALLTGRYNNRTGVWHTIMGRSLLREDETTLANAFTASGYRTGFFGKWHLGDNYPFRPEDRGFQEVVRHGGGGVTQAPDAWGNDYFDDAYYHNGELKPYEGYCTDVWFDEAMRFIQREDGQPFFCYLSTNAPHSPFTVPPRYRAPYQDNPDVPNSSFYGMITNIDENLGRLEQTLHEQGLYENTLLIFLTDNGTAAGFRNGKGFNDGMRGTKGSEYDGGHRVPCLVRWPAAGWNDGRDIDRLSAHIDWMPTLTDICGLNTPDALPFDGRSLRPLVDENSNDWPDRSIVVDSQRIDHPKKWRKCSVMTQRWRLVNGEELYDIQADPGQRNNIAHQHPAIVERLRQQYEQWWQSISTRFDEYCRIVIGSEQEPISRISSHDWHGDEVPWNQRQVREGMAGNGWWALRVARAGRYRFELCRWPKTAETPIQGALPASQPTPDGFSYPPGKALPIEAARLRVGPFNQTKPVGKEDRAVVFEVDLQEGPVAMQTWLLDGENTERGAYYVYVQRIA